jgi:predicted AAA+ superfamily ATPase
VKRLIDVALDRWLTNPRRKALLIRGARQVGKTFSARALGERAGGMVEVNLERMADARKIFSGDLVAGTMLRDLGYVLGRRIPDDGLLFIDEIQAEPRALLALRYFYEELPSLRVLAAGSLVDFAIERVGVPVGRVSFLHLHPLSFAEFLHARGRVDILEAVASASADFPLAAAAHAAALRFLREYFVVGGMPEAVATWCEGAQPDDVFEVHRSLVSSYRQDFSKYAKSHQVRYLDILLGHCARSASKRFIYAQVPGDHRKRELDPALQLLTTAGLVHRVVHSGGNGLPLGAESRPERFKPLLLDIGFMQALLGARPKDWLPATDDLRPFINHGDVTEAFVGQELLAYQTASSDPQLYYWQRDKASSQAEVDYLTSLKGTVRPVEVKAGKTGRLKSLQVFLNEKRGASIAYRVAPLPFSRRGTVETVPLYAVSHLVEAPSPALSLANC